MFAGSVADNLLYGRPEASREEIVQAAKRAHAHAFIEALPHGYDTDVGERGVKLSGGQKQHTTIVIAHRLSTVRHAERILVLSDQGVAEEGTHEKLLAADGAYARLYSRASI